MLRSLPIDYGKLAIIALVGGLFWSVVAHFAPKRADRGLDGLVRDALAPLHASAKKSKEAVDASPPSQV